MDRRFADIQRPATRIASFGWSHMLRRRHSRISLRLLDFDDRAGGGRGQIKCAVVAVPRRVERGHRLRSTEQHGAAVLLEVCRDWVGMNVASMDVGKARFVLPRAKEMDLMTSRLIEESQSRLTQCSPR